MGRGEKIALWSLAAYLAVAIVTFGYAASLAERDFASRCPHGVQAAPGCVMDDAAANGMAAAFLWPFYWSWEAWS